MSPVPAIATMEFDELTHTYRVDGQVVPSVTQILQALDIVDYSYIPPAVREAALLRGRKVHIATHFDDQGDLDEQTVPEEILPYVFAWRRFRQESGFQPELIEHRGFNATY